nr:protein kinase-like domain, phloem protein 2-like protein [Tanacetum cinerariifolium]
MSNAYFVSSYASGLRLEISVGLAHALSYIHYDEARKFRVLHKDIYTFKVLLDDNCKPKLSSFEMSRKIEASQKHHSFDTSKVWSTNGYTDPNYEKTNSVNHKTDVYSFGIVLFELLCGMKSLLLKWVKRLKICVVLAHALSYIHYDEPHNFSILHQNISSYAILLNDDWEPKLSECQHFMKTKASERHHSFHIDSVLYTKGYTDPTYLKTKSLNQEAVIYSFGILLFELLCDRKSIIDDQDNKPQGHSNPWKIRFTGQTFGYFCAFLLGGLKSGMHIGGKLGRVEKVKALGANGEVSGSRVRVVWMVVDGGNMRARLVSKEVAKVVLLLLRGEGESDDLVSGGVRVGRRGLLPLSLNRSLLEFFHRTKHHESKMGPHEEEDKCQDDGQQHTGDMLWANRESTRKLFDKEL